MSASLQALLNNEACRGCSHANGHRALAATLACLEASINNLVDDEEVGDLYLQVKLANIEQQLKAVKLAYSFTREVPAPCTCSLRVTCNE